MQRETLDIESLIEIIVLFRELMKQAKPDYQWCKDEQKRLEGLTSDYMHAIELDDLLYADRAKMSTALKKQLQYRRECKDTQKLLSPLVELFDSPEGRRFYSKLGEAVNTMKSTRKKMQTRQYTPKVQVKEEQG